MASAYTTSSGNTVKYDNGPSGWTEYNSSGQAVGWGTAARSDAPKSNNSIGSGYTPTGSSSVATSGLGGSQSTGMAPINYTTSNGQKATTYTNYQLSPAELQAMAAQGYNVQGVTNNGLGGGSAPAAPSKPNLFYTPGDATTAQSLSSRFNLVPYTPGTQVGSNDVVLGGTAVIPGNYSNRIAGLTAADTAAQAARYAGSTPAQQSPNIFSMGSATTPATKANLYYTPGDAQAAQQLSAYYNLVPYTQGTVLGANDKAIGGSAVIPDSALPNSSARIAAGYDSAGTMQQVAAYANAMAQISPDAYMQMPQNQLAQLVQQNAQNMTSIFGQVQQMVQQAIQPQNANVAPILSSYMSQLDNFFTQFMSQAQDAYKNGMNDPGLMQAVAMIKDESAGMKQQLDEELNARNMSQSGVWVNAMNAQDKAAQQAAATAISSHLSDLTKALQDSMTNVLNQRVAVINQFAGYASQAEIESAKLHVQQMQNAIQGLGSLAQTMQAGVNNLTDNATSLLNTQAQVNQSNLNNQRDNLQSNINSQRAADTEQKKIDETVREYNLTNTLDWAKLDELIRSNKASEAVAMVKNQIDQYNAQTGRQNADTNRIDVTGYASGGSAPASVPSKFWEAAAAAGSATGVDPVLLAAIGKLETTWGQDPNSYPGYSLGYGDFGPGPNNKATQYADKPGEFTNQTLSAAKQIAGYMKDKPLTKDNLMDFSKNSWKAGDPVQWANSVWTIYEQLKSSQPQAPAAGSQAAQRILQENNAKEANKSALSVAISRAKSQLDANGITPDYVLSSTIPSLRNSIPTNGSSAAIGHDITGESALIDEFESYAKSKKTPTTSTSNAPWWQQIFTPSQSTSDIISTMWGN